MEALIKPEFGLAFWTITCFVLLVFVLSKTAWKPLLKTVEERERAIKNDRQSAEAARAEAEKLKTEMEARLAALKAEIQRRLDEAKTVAEEEKPQVLYTYFKQLFAQVTNPAIDPIREELVMGSFNNHLGML